MSNFNPFTRVTTASLNKYIDENRAARVIPFTTFSLALTLCIPAILLAVCMAFATVATALFFRSVTWLVINLYHFCMNGDYHSFIPSTIADPDDPKKRIDSPNLFDALAGSTSFKVGIFVGLVGSGLVFALPVIILGVVPVIGYFIASNGAVAIVRSIHNFIKNNIPSHHGASAPPRETTYTRLGKGTKKTETKDRETVLAFKDAKGNRIKPEDTENTSDSSEDTDNTNSCRSGSSLS